jgi:hypothetical protein
MLSKPYSREELGAKLRRVLDIPPDGSAASAAGS